MTFEPRWDWGVALRPNISTAQTAVLSSVSSSAGTWIYTILNFTPGGTLGIWNTSLLYCWHFFLSKVWFSGDEPFVEEKKYVVGQYGKWMLVNKLDWNFTDTFIDCMWYWFHFVVILFWRHSIVCICSYDGIFVNTDIKHKHWHYRATVLMECILIKIFTLTKWVSRIVFVLKTHRTICTVQTLSETEMVDLMDILL